MQEFDAFGEVIADYYHGDKKAKITVHSKDFPDQFMLTARQLFRSVRGLPDLEKEAMIHCKGKILDIGAGAGSHTLILQEMGADVTALEISEKAVGIMQKRGVKKARQMNIFDLTDEKYDTLLLLMNGLGIAGKLIAIGAFLSHLKTLLAPGGTIIAESSDLLYFADDEEQEAARNSEEYYGEVRYQLEYKNKCGKEFDWVFVDYERLRTIAAAQGFKAELLFEDSEGGYLVKLYLEGQ